MSFQGSSCNHKLAVTRDARGGCQRRNPFGFRPLRSWVNPRDRKASILLLTLFLILLASLALTRFTEKAMSEIMGEAMFVERDRLRIEAYSLMETTLAVMADVARINGGLFDPEQGWGDPLYYAGVELPETLDANIQFIDEMGKISLPMATREQLLRLFETLGLDAVESEELADAYMSWINQQYAEASISQLSIEYERAELPFRPRYGPIQSFLELAAVRGFSEVFFDAHGAPNEKLRRLAGLASLYQFQQVNVNSASDEVMRIWAGFGDREMMALELQSQQPVAMALPYFRTLEEASEQIGMPLSPSLFTVSTQCVRVMITVADGGAPFLLSAVVAPPDAAAGLRAAQPADMPVLPPETRPARQGQAGATQEQPQQVDMNFPFAFIELRENENVFVTARHALEEAEL